MDHSFKADKEMAGRGGQVRKHEESGETPIKPKKPMSSRPPVSPSTTSGAAMAELRSMLIEVKNGQNRLCENLDKKLTTLTNTVDNLRSDIFMELSRLNDKIKMVEERLEAVESAQPTQTEYSTDTTVVVINFREQPGESIADQCQKMLNEGLGLRQIKPVRCTRLLSRDSKPGLVKIQCATKQDKINILKNKGHLQSSTAYKRVYVRSAQTHEERMMRLNMQTLLKDLPHGDRYRFTGNGRLVKKTEQSGGQQTPNQEQPRRPTTPAQSTSPQANVSQRSSSVSSEGTIEY